MRYLRISRAISGVVGLVLVMTFIVTATPVPKKMTAPVVVSAARTSSIDHAGVSSIPTSRSINRPDLAPPPKTAVIAAPAASKNTAPAQVIGHYTVKGGDTLSQIAVDHRLSSWHPLASANADTVKNPDLILVGQKLRVPTGNRAARAPQAQVRPKLSHKKPSVHQHPKQTRLTRQAHKPSVVGNGSPQAIARQLLASRGWSNQWGCLNSLINRESGWNVHADNPHSDAYGIPQALPGSKMAAAGSNWRDSARTQLEWMMGYIHGRYGSPCGAWRHSQNTGWY